MKPLSELFGTIEVRALNTPYGVFTGRYDNIDKLYDDILTKPYDWYFVFNPIKDIKASNSLVAYASWAAKDSDISHIDWLLIDVDPVRETGKAATDEQKLAAQNVAAKIEDDLRTHGWGSPIMVDSGNGVHLYYQIDQENTAENARLRADVLIGLSDMFSTHEVKIDSTVYNAARIARLPGSINTKGGRPCQIMHIPDVIGSVNDDQLREVAAESVYDEQDSVYSPIEVWKGISYMEDFIAHHGLVVRSQSKWKNGYKWLLHACPFCGLSDHNAILTIAPNGAKGYKCSHDRCQNHKWAQLKLKLEGKPIKIIKDIKDSLPPEGPWKFTGWLDFFEDGFCTGFEREWIIPEFIGAGQVMLFAAYAKQGKSTILMHLIRSLAIGGDWLGEKVVKPVNVLYYDYEMDPSLALEYMSQAVKPEDIPAIRERVRYGCRHDSPLGRGKLPPYVDVPSLETMVTGIEPGVLIIDTMRGAFHQSPVAEGNWEVNSSVISDMIRPLSSFCRRSRWSIIMAHHFNRNDKIAGSNEIEAAVDIICEFRRVAQTNQGKYSLRGRGIMDTTKLATWLGDGINYEGTENECDERKEAEKKNRYLDSHIEAIEIMLAAQVGEVINATELREVTKRAGINSVNKQTEMMSRLVAKGILSEPQFLGKIRQYKLKPAN